MHLSAIDVPLKFHWSAVEVLLKCCWSAIEVRLKCQQPTATAEDNTLLTPPISTLGWSTLWWLRKPEKVEKRKKSMKPKKTKIVSLQAKISNTPFDKKFVWPPEVGILQWRRQTYRRTWRLYDWPGPGGRICENLLYTDATKQLELGRNWKED